MLEQFTGRVPGSHAYLECILGTDLSDYGDESIPPHKQVDVRLPNHKVLRLPYAWLRGEPEVFEDTPSEVLDDMLDVSEEIEDALAMPMPKKAVVKRAAPGQ